MFKISKYILNTAHKNILLLFLVSLSNFDIISSSPSLSQWGQAWWQRRYRRSSLLKARPQLASALCFKLPPILELLRNVNKPKKISFVTHLYLSTSRFFQYVDYNTLYAVNIFRRIFSMVNFTVIRDLNWSDVTKEICKNKFKLCEEALKLNFVSYKYYKLKRSDWLLVGIQ